MNFGIKKIVLACGLSAMVSLFGLSAAMAQPDVKPVCEQGKPCEPKAEVKKQSKQSLKAVNTSTKKSMDKVQVKTAKASADMKKTAVGKNAAELKKAPEAKQAAASKMTAQKKKIIEETLNKQ